MPIFPEYDAALFEQIHQSPTYLPPEENVESIRIILSIAVAITIVHRVILLTINVTYGLGRAGLSKDEKEKSHALWKASYQLTNIIVNLTLGCVGVHYELRTTHSDRSIENKIIGYEDARFFAMGQIGYQMWALPVGLCFVGEPTSMIVHHIAVICVASVSTFLSCGFRYFIPFFYGVIEISSVPLAIMNAFKNNPSWIESHPNVYSNVRLSFGLTFLIVRVVLWTPFYWDFITLGMMLLRASDGITKVILGLFNLSSIVLTLLQYFWASKIISALLKRGSSKTEKVS